MQPTSFRQRCGLHRAVLWALFVSLSASPALAEKETVKATTVRVAASKRYKAGRLHRFAMGDGYRDLWEAKISLPVLDLTRVGGGLTPRGRFGGLQTAVLAFRGADGRAYSFRGTDKDPSAILEPELHETIIRVIVQDQMAAQHPGGPLVAGVLSEAAGVLTIHERMVVMPDDPSLGKYRKEFAGMVGSFYEYPLPASSKRPGFHEAAEIIDHKQLYARLSRGHGDQVLVQAFLRARLLDMLLGDFDRHRKQWRWARLPGEPRWQPIPEDRDQAFVRYDGAGQRLAYIYVPILQRYGPDYPWIKGLTLHGWEQDRWLLAELDWAAWQPVVRDLQARLSDEVIDRAVRALPPEYAALDGERLRTDIRGRRDKLPGAARRYYEHLAAAVNVQASDAAELVQVHRSPDGTMRVEVRERAAGADAEPVFTRRFSPEETDHVRIYLRGGDDVVKVQGKPGTIQLRVIAEAGKKILDDSAGGGTRFYDAKCSAEVRKGLHTVFNCDAYKPPPPESGFVDVEDVPPRDWGYDVIPYPKLGYESDVGVFIGAGAYFVDYGFRKHPWSSRHKLSAGFATGALLPIVEYEGEYRAESSSSLGLLDVRYTGIEIIRYHGLGNETARDGDDAFYRVRNQQIVVAPGLSWSLFDDRLRLSAGVRVGYSTTERGDRLIDLQSPYGSGGFGHLGASARLVLDLRRSEWDNATLALPIHDNPAAGYATGGVLLDVRADASPPVWDVTEAWGSVEGSIAGYLGFGGDGRLAISARVGGKWTWGQTPYFGAAYLGGGNIFSGGATARGFRPQRFAGEASVYGNLDLRLFLVRVNLLVPSDLGVNAFADAGRVFVSGQSSDDWHPSGGGGIWLAPLRRTNTLTFSVAASEEDVLFYVRAGFHY